MRPFLLLSGVLLLGLGSWTVFHGLSYSAKESFLRVGDLQATYREEHPVPPWIGGVGIGLGLALSVAGLRRGG